MQIHDNEEDNNAWRRAFKQKKLKLQTKDITGYAWIRLV